MIDKIHGQFYLCCDICGEKAEETFDEFSDAVEYAQDEGWKRQKKNGEWQNICPECAKT